MVPPHGSASQAPAVSGLSATERGDGAVPLPADGKHSATMSQFGATAAIYRRSIDLMRPPKQSSATELADPAGRIGKPKIGPRPPSFALLTTPATVPNRQNLAKQKQLRQMAYQRTRQTPMNPSDILK